VANLKLDAKLGEKEVAEDVVVVEATDNEAASIRPLEHRCVLWWIEVLPRDSTGPRIIIPLYLAVHGAGNVNNLSL
jgi:hypothetical protein